MSPPVNDPFHPANVHPATHDRDPVGSPDLAGWLWHREDRFATASLRNLPAQTEPLKSTVRPVRVPEGYNDTIRRKNQ